MIRIVDRITESAAKASAFFDRIKASFIDLRRTAVETDYYILANKVTAKIKSPIDRFQKILTEANYQAEPRNIWSLLFGRRRELPETTNIEVGEKMFDGSKKVGNRFMWTAIFAAFTTHTLIMAAAVMAVVGGGLFALEYYRAKKDREDIITEINFAGQKVEGRRADLCRLHQAQASIMNLSSVFRQASLESTTDTIARIMKSVEVESQRVKILDPGPFGAIEGAYDFSRPQISLVNKDEREAAAQPVFGLHKLRDSWRAKREHEEDILDTMVALQKSLPPQMKRKFVRELQRVG